MKSGQKLNFETTHKGSAQIYWLKLPCTFTRVLHMLSAFILMIHRGVGYLSPLFYFLTINNFTSPWYTILHTIECCGICFCFLIILVNCLVFKLILRNLVWTVLIMYNRLSCQQPKNHWLFKSPLIVSSTQVWSGETSAPPRTNNIKK